MNKVKNIASSPVTAGNFDKHLERYLANRDLVILPRQAVVQITEALGTFGVAMEILGTKGLLDVQDDGPSLIEVAKK